MAVADEEMLNEIVINKLSTDCTLTTSLLSPVLIDRNPLCKSLVRNGYYDFLLLDEILRGSVFELSLINLSSSSVSIGLTDSIRFSLQDPPTPGESSQSQDEKDAQVSYR